MRRGDYHLALLRAAEPALAAIGEDRLRAPKRLRPLFSAIAELLFEQGLDREWILDEAGFVDPGIWDELAEEVGETGWSYVRGARLETAAHLLLETPISIKDIAELVGYSSVPTFRRRLREFLKMPASRYRRIARKRLQRAGPLPAGAETRAYWERMQAGELSDDEARELDAYLARLAPAGERSARVDRAEPSEADGSASAGASGPAEPGGDGDEWEDLRRTAAEGFIYTCGLLPPAEQRRLIRDAVWFPDATLFERLSEEGGKVGGEEPEKAVQWALLAIDSLAANGMLQSDPRLAALAWARLGRARWLAGDEAEADEDLERSARDAARTVGEAPVVHWEAERCLVAAAFQWSRGRRRRALDLAQRAVGLHREVGTGGLAECLLLRAELRAQAAETSTDGADRELLVEALTDLEEARGLRGRELDRDLVDLWCRLLVAIDDHAEIMAALTGIRRAADLLGDGVEPLLLWLEGHSRTDGRAQWRQARERFAALGDELWATRAALDLARLHLVQDRAGDAARLARELASSLGAMATSPEELAALKALARAAAPGGTIEEDHLDAAERVLRRLERERRARRALRFVEST